MENRKLHWNYPKISKYRKPPGFVKPQYHNLKQKFPQNLITANPYAPSFKLKPVVVQHNTVFIVDLKREELKDLGADDSGAWEISCPQQRLHVVRENDYIKSFCHTKENGEGVITLGVTNGPLKISSVPKIWPLLD